MIGITASKLTVAVGMSGGVDSAVAAWILKQLDYNIFGLFMKNWEEDDNEACAAAEDLSYAKAVCKQLAIPLHVVSFSAEYWEMVFQVTLAEYQRGRTPNPDILCNRKIKFDKFLHYAQSLGADKIATGHYAGIKRKGQYYHLIKSQDHNKDQTYFLHLMNQEMLGNSIFPLSDITKANVRKIAKKHALKSADRKDSTGICFIGERPFQKFLSQYLPPRKGQIMDENKQLIGEHNGVWFYTIGQRQGLGIGGLASSAEAPWYVADKDLAQNRLHVVQGHDHPSLLKHKIEAEQVHWITEVPSDRTKLYAKIRHRQIEQDCRIEHHGNTFHAYFDTPQWGVAPGQSIVLYDDNACIGGGIISKAV